MVQKKCHPYRDKGQIIYFDNSATSLRPRSFVDSYSESFLAQIQDPRTLLYNLALKIAGYFQVDVETISFTPGATFSVNEIAYNLRHELRHRTLYLSSSEHSSNHVIWLSLSQNIKYFDLSDLRSLNPQEPSIISFPNLSNLEGIFVDLQNAKKPKDAIFIVDASQFVQHYTLDLSSSPVDYLFFSAHKFFGSNGIGVIYSRSKDLSLGINYFNYSSRFRDYQLDFRSLKAWNDCFEDIAKDFKSGVVSRKIRELSSYFISNFPQNEYVELLNKDTKSPIFLVKLKNQDISSHDYSFYLSRNGVIVRSGLSCSLISQEKFDSHQIFRVSLSYLNEIDEIKVFFNLVKNFSLLDCL